MKFKSIFWLFNAVVVLALILFAIASFFLFGRDYASTYWGNIWIVAALFVALIGILDFYFVSNWHLFDLLEKEDWPRLLAWLERRIYGKGKLRRPYANLLINTALSVSNFAAVEKLETEVRQRKPDLLRVLGVSLGIPVLLEEDGRAIAEYFGPLADDSRTQRRDWARWCRAFASGAAGREELLELLDGKDTSVLLLSIQILDQMNWESDDQRKEKIEEVRQLLRASLTGDRGERLLQRSRENHLMAIVLSSRVNEARTEILAQNG